MKVARFLRFATSLWRRPARALSALFLAVVVASSFVPARVLVILLSVEVIWLLGASCYYTGARASNQRFYRAATSYAVFVLGGVVLSYHRLIYRASPTELNYDGVYTSPGKNEIVVGTLGASDVQLPPPADSAPGWTLSVARVDGRLMVRNVRGADGVRVHANGRGVDLGALRFTHDTMTRVISWGIQENTAQTVRITLNETAAGVRFLVAGADTGRFPAIMGSCEAVKLLRTRAAHRMLTAMRLDQLEWSGPAKPTWSYGFSMRDSSLQFLQPPTTGCGSKSKAKGDLLLIANRPEAGTPGVSVNATIGATDTITVYSAGTVWSFGVRSSGGEFTSAGMAIRFYRNPRPRLSSIPSRADCGDTSVECGLISSHPMAGIGPLLLLGGTGLDTSRFDLIARESEQGDSIEIITKDSVERVAYNTEARVPAEQTIAAALSDPQDQPGYILSFRRHTLPDLLRVFVACLGILALWRGAAILSISRKNTPDWVLQDPITPLESAGWMMGLCFVTLVGLRLVLGLRVSEAEPHLLAGRQTAFAMAIVPALTMILLRGRVWFILTGAVDGFRKVTSMGAVFVLAVLGLVLLNWMPTEVLSVGLVIVLGLKTHNRSLGNSSVIRSAVMLTFAGLVLAARSGSAEGTLTDSLQVLAYSVLAAAGAAVAYALPRAIRSRYPQPTIAAAIMVVALAVGASRSYRPALFAGVLLSLNVLAGANNISFPNFLPDRKHLRVLVAISSIAGGAGLVWFLADEQLRIWGVGAFLLFCSLVYTFGARVCLALAPTIVAGLLFFADAGMVLFAGIPLCVGYLLGLEPEGGGVDAADVPRLPSAEQKWYRRRLGLPSRNVIRSTYVVAMALAVFLLCVTLLFPNTDAAERSLRGNTDNEVQQDSAFKNIGGRIGSSLAASTSGARALIRGLAARNPDLLERALLVAGVSRPQQEIPRSLEQVRGGIAYSSAGWLGVGLVSPVPLGRGVPTAVAYAENTFAVFILHEQGLLGGLAVLGVFLLLACIFAAAILRTSSVRIASTSVAFPVAAILLIAGSAFYVAAANIGLVPLTGQNIPFLGLNSWGDVLLYAGLAGQLLTYVLDEGFRGYRHG